MLETNIPYKSIIMRCDVVDHNAFSEPIEGFSIVQYNDNMKSVFNISKNDTYGNKINEYEDSILLLKNIMDNESFQRLVETAVW